MTKAMPTACAATAMVARRVREKARKIAAHLLEVSEDDIEYEAGRFSVKGAPDKAKTIQEVAFAAYTDFPDGMEAGRPAGNYAGALSRLRRRGGCRQRGGTLPSV